MVVTSRCPSCLTALPTGARGCGACGMEFTTAQSRRRQRRRALRIGGAALLIVAGGWWLRGAWDEGRPVEETDRSRTPSGGDDGPRPATAALDGPVAGRSSAGSPETRPSPAAPDVAPPRPPPQKVVLESRDREGRRLRNFEGVVVEAGGARFVVVALATLNGADRVAPRAAGDAPLEPRALDGGDLVFLAPAPAEAAAAAIAPWSELAVGASLDAGVVVARDERERFVDVPADDAWSHRFVLDAANRLVGVARAAIGGRTTIVTLAGAFERLPSARTLDLANLQATFFERDAGAQRELAGFYAAGGHYVPAIDHYLAAAELDPGLRAEVMRPATAVVELALREARLRDALEPLLPLLERAARRFDREPRVLHAYGLALLDLGEAEEALPWFLDAASISGASDGPLLESLRAAYLHAGEAARADRRPARAIELLEEGLARFREEPALLLALGYAYYEMGDRERAAIVLQKAASLDEQTAATLAPLLATLAPAREAPAGDFVEIRFQRGSGAIKSAATFDDRVEAQVIVDTGASITAIGEGLADRLKIDRRKALRTVTVTTANGKLQAPVVMLGSLDLAGARVTQVEAVVLPLDAGGGEALVGLNFLEHFDLSLDAQRGVLRLAAKR